MTNEQKDSFFLAVANFEGFRSVPYYCPSGHLTIGFGHRIRDNERQRLCSCKLSWREAFELLKKDFDEIFAFLAKQNFILQENEIFALADICFNVGCSNLASRSMWQRVIQYSQALSNNEHKKADELSKYIAERMLHYCHYSRNGKTYVSDGLLARRRFDSRLWLGDFYVLK